MVKEASRCPKRFNEKATEAFPVIVGNVVDAILIFSSKAYMGFNCFFFRAYRGIVDAINKTVGTI